MLSNKKNKKKNNNRDFHRTFGEETRDVPRSDHLQGDDVKACPDDSYNFTLTSTTFVVSNLISYMRKIISSPLSLTFCSSTRLLCLRLLKTVFILFHSIFLYPLFHSEAGRCAPVYAMISFALMPTTFGLPNFPQSGKDLTGIL